MSIVIHRETTQHHIYVLMNECCCGYVCVCECSRSISSFQNSFFTIRWNKPMESVYYLPPTTFEFSLPLCQLCDTAVSILSLIAIFRILQSSNIFAKPTSSSKFPEKIRTKSVKFNIDQDFEAS